MDKYKEIKKLGDGAFGCVVKAQNVQNGDIVAIKKMKQKYDSWEECMNLRELKSLRKLVHPNIIKLKEVVRVNSELNFVFEYVEKNMYTFYEDYKKRGESLPEENIKSIVYQIASALSFMHKHGFFHRDLKPENLLISPQGIVKLIDFGLAREIRSRPPFTEYVSTRWYRAPEILLRSTSYNSPVDIFALGCIAAELYLSKPIFSGVSEIDQLQKICSNLGTPVKSEWPEGFRLASQKGFTFPQYPSLSLSVILTNASPEAVSLITDMMRWDPNKRPTALKVLSHNFFNDINNYLPKQLSYEETKEKDHDKDQRNSPEMSPDKYVADTKDAPDQLNIFSDSLKTTNPIKIGGIVYNPTSVKSEESKQTSINSNNYDGGGGGGQSQSKYRATTTLNQNNLNNNQNKQQQQSNLDAINEKINESQQSFEIDQIYDILNSTNNSKKIIQPTQIQKAQNISSEIMDSSIKDILDFDLSQKQSNNENQYKNTTMNRNFNDNQPTFGMNQKPIQGSKQSFNKDTLYSKNSNSLIPEDDLDEDLLGTYIPSNLGNQNQHKHKQTLNYNPTIPQVQPIQNQYNLDIASKSLNQAYQKSMDFKNSEFAYSGVNNQQFKQASDPVSNHLNSNNNKYDIYNFDGIKKANQNQLSQQPTQMNFPQQNTVINDLYNFDNVVSGLPPRNKLKKTGI